MESTKPSGSVQPRGTRNAIDATDVPTSRIVKRGAAPKGTFQIPDSGLHVVEEQSFLSRFQKNRPKLFKTAGIELAPSPNLPEPIPPQIEQLEEFQEDITTQVSQIGISPRKDENGIVHQKNDQNEEKLNSQQVDEEVELRQKHAEEEADAAEDDLINVLSDDASLLHDHRPSFPILRFCAAKALLDQQSLEKMALPLGFMWAPFGDIPDTSEISRPPQRCRTCSSFLAAGNGAESIQNGKTTWKCCFCGRDDNQIDASLTSSPELLPEISGEAVEYLNSKPVRPASLGKGAMVVIADQNLEPHQAEWLRESVSLVHASATSRDHRFILITVGGGCSVAMQSSDNTDSTPMMEMMTAERAAKLTREEKERYFLSKPNETKNDNGEEIESVMTDCFIKSRTPFPNMKASSRDVSENGNTDTTSEKQPKSRLEPYLESRRLDIAISVACELLSNTVHTENTRILCMLTGPPTCAMQSPEHTLMQTNGNVTAEQEKRLRAEYDAQLLSVYEQAGSRAGDLRVAVDFICFGSNGGFAGPILLAAAKRSRGGLLYTGTHGFSSSTALAEAASYFAERSSNPGVVSIRISSPLTVARVIGPAFPTAAPHTYAIPGIDPSVGFTVVLRGTADTEHKNSESTYATLQLAAKSLNRTRVITIKVPLTRSVTEYIGDLDSEVSALVLGKACVVSRGALTQPTISSQAIDTAVARLLRGSEHSVSIARILYELRRGLLLEDKVHPDCALVLRSFFLRSEASLASLLMSPRLFTNAMSDENTGLMAEVPLEKLHVKDDAVLVLDTGFSMFVYVAENASAEAEEAISESARTVAAQRVSPCQLWKLRPGYDAEFLLSTYLASSDESTQQSSDSPVSQGFIPYCVSVAPDAKSVKLLQRAQL